MVTLGLMTPSGLRNFAVVLGERLRATALLRPPWLARLTALSRAALRRFAPLLCASAHEGEAGSEKWSSYRPAWVPARAGSALASNAATDGVMDAAATVILPCRRSSA